MKDEKTPKSEKRKRDAKVIGVRVSEDELKQLTQTMVISNVDTLPDLLRRAGLKKKINSVCDKETTLRLLQTKGTLGKIGGLLKLHLNQYQSNELRKTLDSLGNEIDLLKMELSSLALVINKK